MKLQQCAHLAIPQRHSDGELKCKTRQGCIGYVISMATWPANVCKCTLHALNEPQHRVACVEVHKT